MTRQQRQQPESQKEEQQQELNRSQKCEGKAEKAQEEWHRKPSWPSLNPIFNCKMQLKDR
jgi:hypothetical protein